MPLVGFTTKTGEKVSLIDAVKNPEKLGLPFPIIAGIINSVQNRGDSISATTLTGCLRKNYWERTLPYYADPSGLIFKAWRGKVIHQVMQQSAESVVEIPGEEGMKIELALRKAMTRFIPEPRFYRSLILPDGHTITVSGQVDLLENVGKHGFNGSKDKVVINDYKTAEPYAVKKIAKEGLNPDHVFQLNFYAWLTRPLFHILGLKLHYLMMSGVASSGTVAHVKEFGRTTEVVIPHVPLWEEHELLVKALPLIQIMRDAFTNGTLPPAYPGRNGWLCKSCPFVDRCDSAILPVMKEPKKEEEVIV